MPSSKPDPPHSRPRPANRMEDSVDSVFYNPAVVMYRTKAVLTLISFRQFRALQGHGVTEWDGRIIDNGIY